MKPLLPQIPKRKIYLVRRHRLFLEEVEIVANSRNEAELIAGANGGRLVDRTHHLGIIGPDEAAAPSDETAFLLGPRVLRETDNLLYLDEEGYWHYYHAQMIRAATSLGAWAKLLVSKGLVSQSWAEELGWFPAGGLEELVEELYCLADDYPEPALADYSAFVCACHLGLVSEESWYHDHAGARWAFLEWLPARHRTFRQARKQAREFGLLDGNAKELA